MATLGANSSDARRGMTSPRPKGRENAKNTTCRNIGIYGYCKFEKDGCVYNHDVPQKNGAGSKSNDPKLRFNVESPSFTPLQPQPNGSQSGRASAISPKSANAAPFTPKSSNKPSPLANNASLKASAPEWTGGQGFEYQEFVPQGFDQSQLLAHNDPQSSAGGLLNPYEYNMQSQVQSLQTSQQAPITNPYLQDPSGALSGAAYFQNPGFTQPLQHHLYAPIAPHREKLALFQRATHDFFIPEDLRQEYQKRLEASVQTLPNSNLPQQLEHFHSLVPLDTNQQKDTTLYGYPTWIYKATSLQDGKLYALRRLAGFRLTSEQTVLPIQPWKLVDCGSVVRTYEIFSTRAFGDSSLIFVSDYHPCSKTIAESHFYAPRFDRHGSQIRTPQNHVTEETLLGYIMQITNAIKAIHSNNLAVRGLHPGKTLITSKNRIRLNGCGILDVVRPDPNSSLQEKQQEDLAQFGRLILAIAVGNMTPYTNPDKALNTLTRTYTERMRQLINWLITPAESGQPKEIDMFILGLSENVMTFFDRSLHVADNDSAVLATTLEDGRISRLMFKINMILDRPDDDKDSPWSETGEKYIIRLFRDYVFHATDREGKPLLSLYHMIRCLNCLDAGLDAERVQLTSRDGSTSFVVTYREVKRAIENAFNELVRAAAGQGSMSMGGAGKGRKG